MGLEQQSDVLGKWYYAAKRTSDNGDRLVDLCEQTGLIIASTFKRDHRRHQLTWQGSTTFWRGTFLSQISENLELFGTSRSTLTTAQFFSASRYGSTRETEEFLKRNRGVPLQPKIDMGGLKDDKCRTEFRQRVSIHVGVRTREKLSDADSFTKCIQDAARETSVLLPRKKFAFVSAKQNHTILYVTRVNCNKTAITSRRQERWSLRRPVGEATLPIWKEHFKTLLNRLAPSAPELEHVHRPKYAVNEEPPTESEVLESDRNLAAVFEANATSVVAVFDSPHRGRLFNALRADGVPGKFVRLLDDMNQRTTAAVRTPAGCTTPFEVVTGVRQGAVVGPFLFNFAVDDIMRRTVDQCPADIVLAPSGCPLTDLEYADNVVILAESSTKLQHVVNFVSKLAAAYGLRLRPDKCKQMWISSRPRTGIRVDGQPIEFVDEFCYLGCTLKNNGSYERDVQQRCAKATSAFNSLTKCLWSTPITNEVKLRVYLSAIRPIIMYGSETWAAPSTVMEKLDCTERKLLRRLLGYFWPRVCHNENLYAEIDVVYRRMTRGKHQHLAPPSKAAKSSLLLWSYINETGRSPCPTSSKEFVGFELEEAT
ncbi:hypothetical protein RB195_015398 [Necator americanus]|uniref:Reverse transcriptase domain-containing protein n=1 Tax=Necator americanus TaxID=51031 RepID=A0ABR1E680_NECAM